MDPKEKLSELVLRQGELKLAAQLQVALAADSRASSLASVLVTLGLAALGGASVLSKLDHDYRVVAIGLLLQTVALLIAAYLCVLAASPVDFYTVGNQPKNWWEDGVANRPIADCLKKESENYQNRISTNDKTIERNAARFLSAQRLAILSPLVILVAYAVHSFL